MTFQNNILKEYLKNVYFVSGTPCGGKTTVSKALAEKYNIVLYDVDDMFDIHKKISNPISQPAMNQEFVNADDFFTRPYLEYVQWLKNNTKEQLEYVIMDLIRLSEKQKVICDIHLTLEEAEKSTDVSRITFLIKNPVNLIDDYCNRPDHEDFKNYIQSTTNVDFAKANCNKTLEYLSKEKYDKIKMSNYFWIERNKDSTVNDTLQKVEKHFGFNS